MLYLDFLITWQLCVWLYNTIALKIKIKFDV
jgi:hypothetical protein